MENASYQTTTHSPCTEAVLVFAPYRGPCCIKTDIAGALTPAVHPAWPDPGPKG